MSAQPLHANPVFREMIDRKVVRDLTGAEVPIHSEIPLRFAEALYRTVLACRPRLVVEIGMAYGASTQAILTALAELGGPGRLISIDPFQSTDWKGCGAAGVARAGHQGRHQLIEKMDYLALPDLLAAGAEVDFAYVDGMHTFDYCLLDFWYLDKMMKPGGVVGFNDCGYLAVDKVLRFVRTHRKYEELDVGLPRSGPKDILKGLDRIAVGQPVAQVWRNLEDRYFKKLELWEPPFNFFANF